MPNRPDRHDKHTGWFRCPCCGWKTMQEDGPCFMCIVGLSETYKEKQARREEQVRRELAHAEECKTCPTCGAVHAAEYVRDWRRECEACVERAALMTHDIHADGARSIATNTAYFCWSTTAAISH